MVLVSASAHAEDGRSLTQGPGDRPAAQQNQPAEVSSPADKTADAPKFVERPKAVDATPTTVEPPKADTNKADTARDKPVVAQATKPQKPRHKRYWTEGRIISELHRHGVYW